jgi:hypothetical protein
MVTNSVKTLGLPTVLSGCFFKNERLNFEGELKKVKENKQPDDQSKQQSSGNYEKYLLNA